MMEQEYRLMYKERRAFLDELDARFFEEFIKGQGDWLSAFFSEIWNKNFPETDFTLDDGTEIKVSGTKQDIFAEWMERMAKKIKPEDE